MKNRDLAIRAKEMGYTHIFTIVKMHFNSNYYNSNKVDHIIQSGKFEPAPFYDGYAHGELLHNLPATGITRTMLKYKIEKGENR